MKYKIAVLVKEHMKNYLCELIGSACADSAISYFSYDSFAELEEKFKSIEYQYDEVMTSGYIPQRIIKNICRNTNLPLNCFNLTVENLYRIVLKESIMRKDFKLSDIRFDFFSDKDSFNDIILNDKNLSSFLEDFNKSLHLLSEDELKNIENVIAARYIDMFKKGEIKYVLTSFYTVVEKLSSNKIDCHYIYHSKNEIEQAIILSQKEIDLKILRANYPAVINISMDFSDIKYSIDDSLYDASIMQLKKAIAEFGKMYNVEFIIKNNSHNFELYTDFTTVNLITKNFTYCALHDFLKKKINFTNSIGYGIGKNIYHARLNAINAKEYDTDQNKSFLMTADDEIITLSLSAGEVYKPVSVSAEYANKIANDIRLSSETIIKIIEIMKSTGNNEFATNDIASFLNVSVRTSNKILSRLNQYGYADITSQKRIGLKGRPQNVYKIKIEH